jgi:hypothetical protein
MDQIQIIKPIACFDVFSSEFVVKKPSKGLPHHMGKDLTLWERDGCLGSLSLKARENWYTHHKSNLPWMFLVSTKTITITG